MNPDRRRARDRSLVKEARQPEAGAGDFLDPHLSLFYLGIVFPA